MKNVIGAVLLTGAVVAGVITALPDAEVAEAVKADYGLPWGEYRLAIADQACPLEGETGYNYVQSKCVYTLSRGGYCGCFTHDDEPLTGELTTAEIDQLAIDHPNWFVDIGVCEREEEGVTIRWVEYAPHYCDADGDCPGASTCHATLHRCLPAPGWTCAAIKRQVPKVLVSHRATRTPLWYAMKEKCCSGCAPGECFVRPGDWAHCPRCLLSTTPACDTHCLSTTPP